LLYGDFEPVQEKFYEKIYVFFRNFVNSEKSNKHFNDSIRILEITISKFQTWESTMSKLYLLTLLYELIDLIKDYLIYVDRPEESQSGYDESIDYSIYDAHSEYRQTEELMPSKRSSNLDVATKELKTSKYISVTIKKHKIEEMESFNIFKNLPENLVKIFEIIVNLSVANEPIVREVYLILFNIFKEVLQELNLSTIINMNKLLLSKCQILMSYSINQNSRSVKLMMISLDCFHEFVKILNIKLKENRSNSAKKISSVPNDKFEEEIKIDQLLQMFKGIVDFILKALYGHSESVTEKIYILLSEILDVEQGMERIVSLSLFESIRHYLKDNALAKTKSILERMFELISAVSFVKIIHIYSKQIKDNSRHKDKKEYYVSQMISLVTSTLIKKLDNDFEDVSRLIFYREISESNWIELWSNEPTSFLKMCIFNYKFELATKILMIELEPANIENIGKSNQISYLLFVEELYQLINCHNFLKRINGSIDKELKRKLLKFVGTIVLLRENDVEATKFLRKIKLMRATENSELNNKQYSLGLSEDELLRTYIGLISAEGKSSSKSIVRENSVIFMQDSLTPIPTSTRRTLDWK